MSAPAKKIIPSDFSKICRTCLSEGEMKPLYEECKSEVEEVDSDDCLIEKLMSCTFVQFAKDDGLPEQICLECIKEISLSFNFAKKCEESDSTLRDCLNQFQNKIRTNNVGNKRKNEPQKAKTKENKQLLTKNQSDITVETYVIETEIIETNDNEKQLNKESETSDVKSNFDLSEFINIPSDKITDIEASSGVKSVENEEFNNEDSNYFNYEDNIGFESSESDESAKKCENKKTTVRKIQSVKKDEDKSEIQKEDSETKISNNKSGEVRKRKRTKPHKTNVTCLICSKVCLKSGLSKHMRTHTHEKPFMCQVCGQRFSLNCNLRRHMMIHTGERPFKCHLCDKEFIQKTSLNDHVKAHMGVREFFCFCGKSFVFQKHLKVHQMRHEPENGNKDTEKSGGIRKREKKGEIPMHNCPVCHRSYISKGVLNTHLLTHGEKTFLCGDCGKQFYTKGQLTSHSRVHTGIKPYTCVNCGKSFSHLLGLKKHTLLHTGIKPYVCTECNKSFTQSHHLKYHMQMHAGIKPYTCNLCGKKFASNNNLIIHNRTHTGERPFPCPICQKCFYDPGSMKKHQKIHGEVAK